MNWYFEVLQKYAVFDGRARRKEYWYFTLFNMIIVYAISALDHLVFSTVTDSGVGLLGAIYFLAVFLPYLSVSIRRLHDTDRTGWWLLINLIPLIGMIVFIVFMASKGTEGDNQYGPSPLTT